MSIQENFSTHGSIACRLNDSGIARQLISLTDPDVGSVTEKDSGFRDACEAIACEGCMTSCVCNT